MIVGHIGGGSGASYEIQKSLRFRANASAYLSRTPGSNGSQTTCTWSGWLKRTPGVAQFCFSATTGAGGDNFKVSWFQIGSDDTPSIVNFVGTVFQCNLYNANYKMRDPSAWYHIVFQWNTTNATAALRARIWVNNKEVTLSGVQPAQNNTAWFNIGGLHTIGKDARNAQTGYWDGYLSEVNFIDGQALDPSYFGEFSAETGAWIPKKYTGTYGTNGFYLPFNDGSNLTNLTADRSGNGNNWTANNISLTAGVTYDWMDDTPTNNFATLNPLRSGLFATPLTSANLNYVTDTPTNGGATATFNIPTSGKWYWEITLTNNGNKGRVQLGDAAASSVRAGVAYYGYIGVDGTTISAGGAGPTLSTYATNDVVGVAVDMDTGKLYFAKNNTWQNSADPVAGTNPVFSSVTYNQLCPAVSDEDSITSVSGSINFGQRPFVYTPPTGFKALCTKNLPTGTITTSGTFSGNASTDGPFVYLNGVPTAMTINGNAVTLGNHADKLANGFKVRSSSASYNSAGSNTYSITSTGTEFKYSNAQGNP